MRDYGSILHQIEGAPRPRVARMAQFEKDIAQDPHDLEQLKFANKIAQISEESMDAELAYLDVMERYRTLERYNIEVPSIDEARTRPRSRRRSTSAGTSSSDSKTKDLRLGKVKEQFREVTKTQAVEFQDEIKALETEFYKSGPGSSGLTLDDGVEIVKEYKRMIAKCNKRKAELMNAENLFNLPVTVYPVLTDVQVKNEKLFTIYGFYSEFKEFQDSMSACSGRSSTSIAAEGHRGLRKRARKTPKDLKENSTFKAVRASSATSRSRRRSSPTSRTTR